MRLIWERFLVQCLHSGPMGDPGTNGDIYGQAQRKPSNSELIELRRAR